MDCSGIVSEISVPDKISALCEEAEGKLIPKKSSGVYERAYEVFARWREENGVAGIDEKIVLAYVCEKSHCLKPSSLWAHYSMVKSMVNVKEGVDLDAYPKVAAFLKQNSCGYKPKKSRILSTSEIDKFLADAPDMEYLMIKVAVVLGIAGACRRAELCSLLIDDIKENDCFLTVRIRDNKNGKGRVFSMISEGFVVDPIALYRKYVALRPARTPHKRLFVFYKAGKCSVQPVGLNSFGKIPMKVAEFLGLSHPEDYTGHCLRRSSATMLADAGGDLLELKRHGGWKSSAVAEGYIEESVGHSVQTARKIQMTKKHYENNEARGSSLEAEAFEMKISAGLDGLCSGGGFSEPLQKVARLSGVCIQHVDKIEIHNHYCKE